MTPQQRAEAAAAAMWANDQATPALGITLDLIAPGAATLSMLVQPHMLNGHRTCHGGYIFTLADSAFAFACNSHGPGAVAAHCDIFFLAPARENDRLVATATERHREGRTGLTDVRVTCGATVIAEFRGHARAVPHQWVPA